MPQKLAAPRVLPPPPGKLLAPRQDPPPFSSPQASCFQPAVAMPVGIEVCSHLKRIFGLPSLHKGEAMLGEILRPKVKRLWLVACLISFSS